MESAYHSIQQQGTNSLATPACSVPYAFCDVCCACNKDTSDAHHPSKSRRIRLGFRVDPACSVWSQIHCLVTVPHSVSHRTTMPSFKVGESSASRVPVDWQPPASATADQCPVDHRTREKWLSAASPPSAPHPLHHSLPTPSPNPSAAGPSRPAASRLGTDRVISSIPRGSVPLPSSESLHAPSAPDHGPPVEAADDGGTAQGKWVYPSEQQFFNAMMRKNHNPQQQDMRTVVPIHNAVNEKAWEEVLLWESGTGSEKCGGPRLVSFSGRPQDRTPKAWLNVALGCVLIDGMRLS